ncbi:hypothetical protein Ahy_A03g014482 [Arachis hypogaea]|uniref:Uncharacterized protein n=1 Tax=Arachis hypogaea TaxID=3818 RepID=A0A445DXU9_ARAHY|nr:hypothetical protein Ahy_A03g014482 [Arachis hypogaea]
MTTFDKITKAPINQAIHCNRDGICESRVRAPTWKNTISAAGCKARIYVKFDKDVQDWVLLKVDLTHSQPCSPKKAVHYHGYRQLTMHAKCMIEDNDEAGIRPNKTFLALSNEAGGPSNLGFSEKDLRNYITARLRNSNVNADVREMMSYFRRMKDINPNFFYAVELDDECKFKSVVWVDARCRASYEYYGNVVSVDSTYRRNRYVVVKLESFEDNWADFIDEYNLHNNTWLSDLYDDRRMWIPIYFKGEFWAAMRNTQRSESMHAFYGGYLHSKTSLVQFVHEYDNVLGFKEQRELEDDAADSRGVIPFDEQDPLVCVMVKEEKLVNDTILCVPYDVHFDHSTQELRYECNLFESSSVLCYHCLEVFHSYKVYKVPSCYVLPRWSKNIKRKHTYVKSSHDISRSDESHVAFRGLCAHVCNVAQEFVGDNEETALLHVALEETMAKLAAHHAKKRSESMSKTQTNIGSQSSNDVSVDDIQGPLKVTTKGRPKSKRLGAALEKCFKNSRRRKQKKSSPIDVWLNLNFVVRPHAFQDIHHGSVAGLNVPEQAGDFMSLLSSFNKK